jgi:hypothetical protein
MIVRPSIEYGPRLKNRRLRGLEIPDGIPYSELFRQRDPIPWINQNRLAQYHLVFPNKRLTISASHDHPPLFDPSLDIPSIP